MPVNEFGQPIGDAVRWTPGPPLGPVALTGRTCRLEPLSESHVDGLFDALCVRSPASVWTYMNAGPFVDRDALAAHLERLAAMPGTVALTVLTPEGNPVGVATWLRIDHALGTAEVGHITFGAALQRTTAATEAMYLMAAHAFDVAGIRRYEWKCDALNAPSRRAAERLGFTSEGVFRKAVHYKGRNRDTAWYAIVDDDWPAVRTRLERWLDPANFDPTGRQLTPLSPVPGGRYGRGMAIDDADKRALTGQEIHDQVPPGWSKVLDRLVARFQTGDFSTGAALVSRIAEAADEANHHPDVDLRYPHVTVTLKSHDVDAITERDVRLAHTVSDLAAQAGASPAEHAPDVLELALDTPDHERVKPFWSAVLGYESGSHPRDVLDPADRTINVWFQDTDSDAPDRQRWHLDVSVPREVAEERIQAAIDAGGRLVSDERAPAFWVLADPDDNRVCICTWESRD